ncbi:MAG: c-type cytochrome [Gemmataceae bacterium]|nr:c-type cytochrome [Gemmataceae bacterium]MDW8264414.1 c-type cytochrome [Gemmataceae bacterium]
MELVAAEPQIESPVAMAFDEDGKLWVVEMRDYPNGPGPGQPPEGRIKVLQDRDGDGRYETARIFAERLLFANGLLPWRGGVIVTAAPHILYLADTDGDGQADRREVLFEGFAAQNPQLRVSFPVLGVDGWVYVANGLRGGSVVRPGGQGPPVNLSGMDFRFELLPGPERTVAVGRHEAISGMGQFGNTFDDWGNRFVCDNRHHLRHVVLPHHFLRRNPHLAAGQVLEDVSETEDPNAPPAAGARVYPLSRNWTTSNLHAGRFTAACGVFIYRGRLLAEHHGAAFTCEPTGNLVHEEFFRPSGATFRSKPAREGVEFLATPDEWFRPVSLAHGPDDALYVVDMYRAVIEHPEFMPVELKNRPDLTLGKDRGRIWRIVPEGMSREAARPALGRASAAELASLLASPNVWLRTTAHRLLLEQAHPQATEPLRQLLQPSSEPIARVQAAWLLHHRGQLTTEDIAALLADGHSRVREHAVRLAAERGADLAREPIASRLLARADDPDPRVRFWAALVFGELPGPTKLAPLARIALGGSDDRWTRWAVASAVPTQAGELIRQLRTIPKGFGGDPTPERLLLLHELAVLVGARHETAEVADVFELLFAIPGQEAFRWQLAGINGLVEGMERRGLQLGAFLSRLPADRRAAAEQAAALLEQATSLAKDPNRPLAERLDGIRLLAHAPWPSAQPVLIGLIADDPIQEVRLTAVRALAAHARPEVPRLLLQSWRSYTPAVRRQVIEVLLRQPERVRVLLDELEAGRLKPGDFDALRTRQLVNHPQADIRKRAQQLLRANLPADRQKVLLEYQSALSLTGDPKRGMAVFQKQCASCHRIANVGVQVGPDISDTRTKTPEMLLLDILNPNQAIDSNYVNYTVLTKSGKALTGIIAVETASSLTLKRADNQVDVVLKQDIEEIQSTGVSLMPEGLEKAISVAEMADLISFLKNWRYLDGSVPLSFPPRRDMP